MFSIFFLFILFSSRLNPKSELQIFSFINISNLNWLFLFWKLLSDKSFKYFLFYITTKDILFLKTWYRKKEFFFFFCSRAIRFADWKLFLFCSWKLSNRIENNIKDLSDEQFVNENWSSSEAEKKNFLIILRLAAWCCMPNLQLDITKVSLFFCKPNRIEKKGN